ncbi:MAG: phosphoribosylanthranilate isomerase [Anaerolineales bacterium]
MSIRIKICGLTNLNDARVAAEVGADYLGFIFYDPSPRAVPSVQVVREIVDTLRNDMGAVAPKMVGVFVNESVWSISQKMHDARLDLAQLSGDESPQVVAEMRGRAYKAIQPERLEYGLQDLADYAPQGPSAPHPAILVDAYHSALRGGTGEQLPAEIAARLIDAEPRLMLAGGLNPDNIFDTVSLLRPYAVDVASGVEAEKGRKDHDKVRMFIQAARLAAQSITE